MRRLVRVAFAIATITVGSSAFAQTTDRERAEAHFEVARGHVLTGRCDLAIEEFRRSIDFEPTSVGARLNLGDCYAKLGRLPEAFREYKAAEANALTRSDPRLDIARQSAAQIEGRLVRVVLREPEPVVPGLVVTVDGSSAGTRPWIIAVTPGQPHALDASAPDGRHWHAEISGNAGTVQRLEIDLGPRASAPEPPPRHASSSVRTLGIVTGAAGIAGVATGTVFGVLASSSRGDLADAVNADPQCTGTYPTARCEPAARQRLGRIEDRAFAESTASTIAFVAGGILLVGGIVIYALAPSAPSTKTSTGAALRIGPGGLLEGSF